MLRWQSITRLPVIRGSLRRVTQTTSPTWQTKYVTSQQNGINEHSSRHAEPEDGMVTMVILQYYERSAIGATLTLTRLTSRF